ncbi:MAG TPA: MFS transporter [Terriglobia bacterium]|nr:MFS transporter [Terriglobia bacterium]
MNDLIERSSTRYLMATACAGLFTFGVMTSFLGATLPELSARLGFDLGRGGALFSFLYIPQIPMVFLAGPLIDRFGKKPVLAGGFLLCAAALIGIAYAPSYIVVGLLLMALGLGGSSAMSAANTLIPDLYPENPSSALNLGGIFFGVGAIFFPWLVTLMTARVGLVPTLWMITLLVGSVAFVALSLRFPPASAAGGFDWSTVPKFLSDPAVILLSGVLFFYSAVEISTAGWIRTFLERELSASAQTSKVVLTVFWIALMLGRLGASLVVKLVRGSRLLVAASMGATAGLLCLTLAPSVAVATAAVVICGLSYAPVFPTTAGTASTYYSQLFATVFGILMTFALLSGAVLPPVLGYVARGASLRAGMWMLVATAILLLGTQTIFVRYERRRFLRTS